MAVLQFALSLALDYWPQVRYPEYGFKLGRLRERLGENPNRTLVLLLGTSRTEVGICPEKCDFAKSAPAPLLFNFAMSGAGPIQHLMLLKDLLREGILPDRLALEVHPLFLNQRYGQLREEARIDVHRLSRADLTTMAQYSEDPGSLRQKWWTWRLCPASGYRHQFSDCLWSDLCTGPGVGQYRQFGLIGPWGWLSFPQRASNRDEYEQMLERTRSEYQSYQAGEFEVTEEPDRAMRALLSLCREHQVAVTMFIMPESSRFAEIYPAGARTRVDEYLAKLRREFEFDLYDASGWMDDVAFADSHHLLPEGAGAFSWRFARDILDPSLAIDDRHAQHRRMASRPVDSPR